VTQLDGTAQALGHDHNEASRGVKSHVIPTNLFGKVYSSLQTISFGPVLQCSSRGNSFQKIQYLASSTQVTTHHRALVEIDDRSSPKTGTQLSLSLSPCGIFFLQYYLVEQKLPPSQETRRRAVAEPRICMSSFEQKWRKWLF
jgi:hypothetical protein